MQIGTQAPPTNSKCQNDARAAASRFGNDGELAGAPEAALDQIRKCPFADLSNRDLLLPLRHVAPPANRFDDLNRGRLPAQGRTSMQKQASRVAYLAGTVAASKAGGSGSVVGDTMIMMTMMMMMWIDGISPLSVVEAYVAAGPGTI
jgi:hypothetical protein